MQGKTKDRNKSRIIYLIPLTINCESSKVQYMPKRISQKTFSELDVGEHFWTAYNDIGDCLVERVKISEVTSGWADGSPGELLLCHTGYEVWTVEYCGWWDYLWRICTVILVLLMIAFGFYYALWGKIDG
jgi:hypothetical protein